MATTTWIRSDNFIDNCTDENYTLAFEIFNEIDARLRNSIDDTDILEYYNFFKPFKEAYEDKFLLWKSLNSSSAGNTFAVKQKIERLRGIEIQKWDVAIQGTYTRDTSTYMSLLPHFRQPFQNGAIELRITSLENLIIAMGDDVKLAAIKLEVEDFLSSLKLAKKKQESQFFQIDLATIDLEQKRLAAAEGIMYVYGKLISKFYKNLRSIDAYFPIHLIQRVMQDLFMATLNNLKVRYICKRSLDIENDTFKVKVIGENNVIGYFTNGLTNQLEADALFVRFPPNSVNDYHLPDLGYSSKRHHFYIVQEGTGTSIVTIIVN